MSERDDHLHPLTAGQVGVMLLVVTIVFSVTLSLVIVKITDQLRDLQRRVAELEQRR